jgi:hypothetical protein
MFPFSTKDFTNQFKLHKYTIKLFNPESTSSQLSHAKAPNAKTPTNRKGLQLENVCLRRAKNKDFYVVGEK